MNIGSVERSLDLRLVLASCRRTARRVYLIWNEHYTALLRPAILVFLSGSVRSPLPPSCPPEYLAYRHPRSPEKPYPPSRARLSDSFLTGPRTARRMTMIP